MSRTMLRTTPEAPARKRPATPPPMNVERRRPELRTYQAVEAERRHGRGPARTPTGASSRCSARRPSTAGTSSRRPAPLKTEVTLEKPRTIITRTIRPTSASTARSTRIGAASTAASIASPGRATPIRACRRGSISRPSSSPSRTRPSSCARSSRRRATSRARSRSAPTPIPTSRSSGSYRITRGDPRGAGGGRTIRSAS